MTLSNGFSAFLGGLIGEFGSEIATAATVIGTAMMLAVVGFMVCLAIGPYYSSGWAARLAASTGEFETDSSESASGD